MRPIGQVLLIDDDEISNFLTTSVIKNTGLVQEIVVCHNGEEAIKKLEEDRLALRHCPDLILLDLNMPFMNGFDFLKAYSKLDTCLSPSVIIVLSTTTLVMDFEQLKEFPEVEVYLNKPLTQESFQYIVDKYFG